MNVMDLSPTLNEYDTPFLVDSGTESYTESPVADEDSEQSEDSTVCNVEASNPPSKCKVQIHILDKDMSVDEDMLASPLEPTRKDYNANPTQHSSHNDQQRGEQLLLPSILRRESSSTASPRKVSFPMVETDLVSYREPDCDGSWMISSYLPSEKILQVYQSSCKRHQTIELDIIKNLITEIKNNTNHSAVLNLSMVNITNEVNETIEDLLKVANFRTLILNECKFTPETISEFFNMLEYYESICEIEVGMNVDEVVWKCFCNACSNIMVLEALSFKGIVINDDYMRMLLNAVKNNVRINTLKFDSCTLVKLPNFYLVDSLMTNTTLCELYLPSTGLYTKEAECLGRFLRRNMTLKVLDISNNFIGDRGLESLAKGLTRQDEPGMGLSVLVIFNNQITEKSGPVISNIIMDCKNLHALNIGYNNLTDEVISNISLSLQDTTSLEGLGLQCTLLTCKGIDFLATAIENNNSLQKINLKGNKAIQVTGLERLCQALTSSKIMKIEIEEVNRSSNDPQAYVQLVKKINAICTVNRSFKENSNDEIANISQLISRKVSLSCEPRYVVPEIPAANNSSSVQVESPIISPVPSRGSSPAPRSRFQITRVQDSHPISRFRVTRVTPSPDEDSEPSKFANVRSSVSSNDSVDSLQIYMDSD